MGRNEAARANLKDERSEGSRGEAPGDHACPGLCCACASAWNRPPDQKMTVVQAFLPAEIPPCRRTPAGVFGKAGVACPHHVFVGWA